MELKIKEIDKQRYTVILWHCSVGDYHLLISQERNVFLNRGDHVVKLLKEFHNNRVCFRIPKTTKRFGKRTLRKTAEKCNVLI